ncbi:carbohydrate ABC transporter membrane protein 2 (CUT1 family) [Orenia marismortui]|uniref:Carbohydrate ABC transporter membrane protein 2 (CUT1 family) n=2 Tax=Orenia marismortui TaxID=46469 RepID=A0A4R8H0T2_9FIRM|nr:carbohydrate ABC transporter permease [Orenia marismortui]TDX51524.1 carbohydrate ABC transporter membrane protein 2 (CUT1 family) [Orenia marismortui]
MTSNKLGKKTVMYLFLILLSCLFLVPMYVLLATSFKSFNEISATNMWNLPAQFSFKPFIKAFKHLLPNILNSFYIAIPATILSALFGSLNGYVLAKWRFKGSNFLFALLLFGMFIPYQSILIPLVRFLQKIDLYGSIYGLILVHVIYGIPITTLIFRNYYAEIPDALIEAAQVDGAGIFKTYTKVFLPISIPGFVVVTIWQFTNIWNEFLFAVTLTNNPASQPVTVALVNLAGSKVIEWNVQMSGAIISAIPTLFIYIFLGRYFMRGLLNGSVKG